MSIYFDELIAHFDELIAQFAHSPYTIFAGCVFFCLFSLYHLRPDDRHYTGKERLMSMMVAQDTLTIHHEDINRMIRIRKDSKYEFILPQDVVFYLISDFCTVRSLLFSEIMVNNGYYFTDLKDLVKQLLFKSSFLIEYGWHGRRNEKTIQDIENQITEKAYSEDEKQNIIDTHVTRDGFLADTNRYFHLFPVKYHLSAFVTVKNYRERVPTEERHGCFLYSQKKSEERYKEYMTDLNRPYGNRERFLVVFESLLNVLEFIFTDNGKFLDIPPYCMTTTGGKWELRKRQDILK